MRLGCVGCLGSLLAIGLLLVVVVGPAWMGFQMLQDPDVPVSAHGASDGFRAQQKIYDVARRAGRGGRAGRGEPVALTEREVSAFLANHLADAADLPLTGVAARLPGPGQAEVLGRLPLRHLLSEEPLSTIRDNLPARWLDRLVWLRLRGALAVETGTARRTLRFDVNEFWIGRQRLPRVLLRLLLHPSALRVLRWPLPEVVESVAVEPGRLVIRTAGDH